MQPCEGCSGERVSCGERCAKIPAVGSLGCQIHCAQSQACPCGAQELMGQEPSWGGKLPHPRDQDEAQ